jgi:hypothetical protein
VGEPRSNPPSGIGPYLFEQVTVRVVEVDAPAAIEMIDLARPLAPEIRVVLDTAGADAGESSVEFGIADREGIVVILGTLDEFAADSLLGEVGFEPLVPLGLVAFGPDG